MTDRQKERARLIHWLRCEMNQANPHELSRLRVNAESLSVDFSTQSYPEAHKRYILNLAAIGRMTADWTSPDSIAAAIRVIEEQEQQDPMDLRNVRVPFEMHAFRGISIHSPD
jgi:hypothetical protein